MCDAVLIIGAGPVGLSAGMALARAGIPIRIIDRLITPTNESRAAIVHARTLEHFERLGFVEDFLTAGVKVRGAAVERGVELIDFEDSVDHVAAARLRDPDGSEKTAEFAYVLGCDGARSTVRGVLDLQMEGETLDTIWMTADVKIRWDRDPDEAITYLSPDGIAFIAPMNDNRWRVVINLPATTKAEAEKLTLDDIQAIVGGRFGADVPLYDPVWISPFGINTRMAPTMRRGRIFLAAMPPTCTAPLVDRA